MKKKIIALLLTIVMCTISLWGCGSSSYFKELKKVVTSGDNIAECTIEIKTGGGDYDSVTTFDSLKSLAGENIGIKTKTQTDDKGNFAIDIKAKIKDATEYEHITTVVKDGKCIYFTTKDLIAFLEKNGFDASSISYIKSMFAKLGIKDACKVDVEQYCELMNIDYDEDMLDIFKHKDDISDYLEEVIDILDKDFSNLTSKDGDTYILNIDKDNVSDAADDIDKFLDKDFKTVYDKTYDLCKKIFSDEITKNLPKYNDISDKVKDYKKSLKEEKSKKTSKNENGYIRSEVNADEKTFSFTVKGTNKSDDYKLTKLNMDVKTKKGNVNIKKLIPENALDLTLVLKQLKDRQSGSGLYNGGNSTATY